ncbi:MAG: hypothetical protein SLAVMIC_00450 [uncultured marine phage]|uniref:Uncharacterized protein n=1 Tax=uncultured marine phage TaxID=707152 RepID=A0A8D9FRJ9_9VIRU|nr:MAG: hypothetical protein SLAVMIC_00450 [uncultured marine phage]
MAIYFSILPPPTGTEGVRVPFIPDIDALLKFAEGEIGIADAINFDATYKQLSSSKFPTLEALEIFANSSNFTTTKELASYDKGNGRYRIPEGDINVQGTDSMGLKALEKTVVKAIFETQKPYIELIPIVIQVLSKLEIISAKGLALIDRSRKPIVNPKSLTYKLNKSKKELNQMTNIGKDKSEPFGNLTEEDKIKGVDMGNMQTDPRQVSEEFADIGNFDWEILSIDYSTGLYIPSIDYKRIYRNIIDNPIVLDDSGDPEDTITEDEKPPVVVFAYYDHNGDVKAPPTQWLDRTFSPGSVGPSITKWYGTWDQLKDNDSEKYKSFLKKFVSDRLFKKLGRRDVDMEREIYNFIEPKIDPKEFVKDANENCFMNRLPKLNKDGLDLGRDSGTDVTRVTGGRRNMFLPKTIRYNGKDIAIDPEADYELQLIKLVPTKEFYYEGDYDVYNQNLKKTTPIAGNYMGRNVRDALTRDQYDAAGYPVIKPTNASPRRVQTQFKYKFDADNTTDESFHDDKVTYVIEGILRENPKKDAEGGATDDDGWYYKPDFFTAIKDFIDILINIFSEVIPEINSLIKLFKSPHEFIFDTIFSKIEENFEAFSGELLGKFKSLADFKDKFEMAEFIKNSPDLKKYVSLDEDLNYRFILDGFAGMELLGFNFGINIVDFLPRLVLEKSNNFSLNNIKKSINGNFLPTQPNNAVVGNGGSTKTGDKKPVNASVRKEQSDGTYQWETVSVEYSTGDFVQSVDYEYIYITKDVENLLAKGDELFEAAIKQDMASDQALDALTNYNMALEKDPNNQLIKDKINELKDKFKFNIQMIVQFLINFVSMPIKLIISILGEIVDFFKGLGKIPELPSNLEEFLSFEWILKYVKPTAILDLIGLKFNPEQLFKWLDQVKGGEVDPDFKFDLSEIVSAPFLFQLPKVTPEQLEIMGTKPLELMTAVFKMIELLIENILCFIWNTLNLDVIIPCPSFNISKYAAADLPLEDLQSVLNGESSALNKGDEVPYKFVYDVKLEDGTIIKDLNYAELQKFMKSNQEFNYEVLE